MHAAAMPARPARTAAASALRPDVATTLQLQRSIGNRRTTALLRTPRAAHPTAMKTRRGEFTQLASAYHAGGLEPQGVERHAEGREGRAGCG